ncbi:MAG TPA: acyl-CoA dehydrogenase family protein [Mycobacteriales bacterium]|nr:acyl-CoA dehydrogenase family protein [Mycobacteriales bacterium]
MTFSMSLTDEQVATKAWAHEFAEMEIRPVAAQYDESEEFPWPVVQKAQQIGLYGLEFFQMAGTDESGLTSAIVSEEMTWGCAGITLAIFGTGLALAGLAGSATPEQLGQWAPRMFAREDGSLALGAFCVTEPSAGSDVSSLRTSAKKTDGGWLLNGRKCFITNGGIADVHIVVATVDPGIGHKGQATFVVPPGTPGCSGGKKERKLGIRASHTADVVFEDCFVPEDCLLGGEDNLNRKMETAKSGTSVRRSGALSTFEATRPIVGAQALGIARAAFEFSRDYAKERVAFGAPIISNQGIAFKLADMATEIECARLLVWRAAWMGRTGVPFTQAEGSMSKLKAGEVAVKVTDEAIQILGGYGYIKDYPVEKWHRDSKIYSIFEGTSEIQRLVISRALAAR